FWRDDVGIPYGELLPIGGGVQQHRFAAGESVVKVNHSKHPLPTGGATTLSTVVIALPGVATSKTLATPDGAAVVVQPSGDGGGTSLRIVVRTPSPEDVTSFWTRIGLQRHVAVEPDNAARYD